MNESKKLAFNDFDFATIKLSGGVKVIISNAYQNEHEHVKC